MEHESNSGKHSRTPPRFDIAIGRTVTDFWLAGPGRLARAVATGLLIAATLVHPALAQGDTAPLSSNQAVAPATPSAALPANAAASPQVAPANNPERAEGATSGGAPTIGAAELPQNLSPWGMFLHANIVVKAVMIGLAFASLVTWTAFVAKALELRAARAAVRRGLRVLAKCVTLVQANEQVRQGGSPVTQLMHAAVIEIRLSANLHADGIKERIALQFERIEMAASRRISRGTGALATIGATAPFVGLFGTVWGIMDSFVGISRAHTTNLAVVAPGIAEALLATALGLVAAIPAVMIYNMLARATSQYRALVGDASAQVMSLAGRDLDRAGLPLSRAAE